MIFKTEDEFERADRASRKKFIDFARIAMNHKEVMDIVNVLHAAAMRAALEK